MYPPNKNICGHAAMLLALVVSTTYRRLYMNNRMCRCFCVEDFLAADILSYVTGKNCQTVQSVYNDDLMVRFTMFFFVLFCFLFIYFYSFIFFSRRYSGTDSLTTKNMVCFRMHIYLYKKVKS